MARQVLPNEYRVFELSEAIGEKAKQTGVNVRSVRRVTPTRRAGTDSGYFEQISFEIQMVGSYDQIARFVNSMEEFERSGPDTEGLRRFFKVLSLEITAARSGLSLTEPHTARLNMATFRYTGGDS